MGSTTHIPSAEGGIFTHLEGSGYGDFGIYPVACWLAGTGSPAIQFSVLAGDKFDIWAEGQGSCVPSGCGTSGKASGGGSVEYENRWQDNAGFVATSSGTVVLTFTDSNSDHDDNAGGLSCCVTKIILWRESSAKITGLGSLVATVVAARVVSGKATGFGSVRSSVTDTAVSTGLITAAGSLTNTATPGDASPILDIEIPPFVVTTTLLVPYITAVVNEDGSPLIGPIRLFINHFEIGRMEWSLTTEEVLGGVGQGTLTVQDRLNTGWEPEPHQDVLAVIRATGWRLFHGETMQPSLSLPIQFPWRRWSMSCRDYNGQLDERLVGTPTAFWRADEFSPWELIDPAAINHATDRFTVQEWMREFFALPDGTTMDTDALVGEYISNTVLGEAENYIRPLGSTLRGALEELAAMADVNVQFWLTPDDEMAWLRVPTSREMIEGADAGLLPTAPSPIGTDGVGIMALEFTKDGGAMPQVLWVNGATTYTYDPITQATTEGGTGWYDGDPSPRQRQAYLSAPSAWTSERRDRIAAAAKLRAQFPTIRGSVTIQGVDGWRVGQVVTITHPLLPPTVAIEGVARVVIQRVATTLYEGTDFRKYVLDWGDGPVGRISQGGGGRKAIAAASVKQPIVTWTCDWEDFGPIGAGETRRAVFTPRNGIGEPWGPPGMPVEFTVVAKDSGGNIVTGQGTCAPNPTTTDLDGKARTTLTAGDQDGLSYEVFVETTVAP